MYVIVWEFIVRPEKVTEFVDAYKSDGTWARLFAQADGYIGTELLRSTDSGQTATFVTIDRWKTAEDFARFLEHFGSEYRRLDTQLEGLTLARAQTGNIPQWRMSCASFRMTQLRMTQRIGVQPWMKSSF
jgi:heme-degrading monooxygenase HmoA